MTISRFHFLKMFSYERVAKAGLTFILVNTVAGTVLFILTLMSPNVFSGVDVSAGKLIYLAFTNSTVGALLIGFVVFDTSAILLVLLSLYFGKIKNPRHYRRLQITSVILLLHGPCGIVATIAICRYLELYEHEFLHSNASIRPSRIIV